MTAVLATTAAVAAGAFFLLWLVSLVVRDASIVDPFWGPSLAVVSWVAYVRADQPGSRGLLLALLVTWAIRLGTPRWDLGQGPALSGDAPMGTAGSR
jgi:steroid 5-alpha reductase family enzyme